MRRNRVPRTRKEFDLALDSAFRAGCDWGYLIEHTLDVKKQIDIGVKSYLEEITSQEANNLMQCIWDGKDVEI